MKSIPLKLVLILWSRNLFIDAELNLNYYHHANDYMFLSCHVRASE